MLLSADIGGTWTRLLAVSRSDGRQLASACWPSADFSSLVEAVRQFQQQHGLAGFTAGCIGLAGPVRGRHVALTNLPWQVDAGELETGCNIGKVLLINDFEAAACGIEGLSGEQLLVLNPGQPEPQGHRLVAGAGTGLGVAPVFFADGKYTPVAGEGGHMSFAPGDDIQQDLLRWLRRQWERVSVERVVSGSGLELIYGFFSGVEHPGKAGSITAARVVERAEAGEPVACRSLTTFVEIYGSCLGDMALLWPAQGGIYIAGGIAAKITRWMQQPGFLQAMQAKGRMTELVSGMPVYLVMEPGLGLRGAACRARELIN